MCYLRRKGGKGRGDRVSIAEEKAEFIVYNRVLDLLSQLGRHWKILKILLCSREEAGSGCSKLGLSSDKERWCLELGYSWPRNI